MDTRLEVEIWTPGPHLSHATYVHTSGHLSPDGRTNSGLTTRPCKPHCSANSIDLQLQTLLVEGFEPRPVHLDTNACFPRAVGYDRTVRSPGNNRFLVNRSTGQPERSSIDSIRHPKISTASNQTPPSMASHSTQTPSSRASVPTPSSNSECGTPLPSHPTLLSRFFNTINNRHRGRDPPLPHTQKIIFPQPGIFSVGPRMLYLHIYSNMYASIAASSILTLPHTSTHAN